MNRIIIIGICLFWVTCCAISCRRNESSSSTYRADTGNGTVKKSTNNGAGSRDEELVAETNPKKTAVQLTAQAVTKMRNGDTDAALLSVQQAIAIDGEFFDARWHLLSMLHDRGIESLNGGFTEQGYNDLVELNKHALWMCDHLDRLDNRQRLSLASANYNSACAFAQRGFTDKAIAALTRAFALGFDDFDQVKIDKDLDPLRELDEFKALIKKHQQEDPDPDAVLPGSEPEPGVEETQG